MTGSIIKRGEKVYLLRLSLGKDSVTGKRLYHTETVHGTRKEAEARQRQLVGEFERGTLVARSTARRVACVDGPTKTTWGCGSATSRTIWDGCRWPRSPLCASRKNIAG